MLGKGHVGIRLQVARDLERRKAIPRLRDFPDLAFGKAIIQLGDFMGFQVLARGEIGFPFFHPEFVLVGLVADDVADHEAFLEDDLALGVFEAGALVVGDHEDEAILAHFLEKPEDRLGGFLVEVARRLVAEDEAGVLDEGAGDGDPLPLAAGQLARISVLEAEQIDFLEDGADAGILVFEVAHDVEGEGDVFLDRQFGDELVVLEDEAAVGRAVRVELFRGEGIEVLPLDEDLAVRLVVEGAKQVQEGALAAAGFAEDEDETGRGQGEGNVDEPAGKGVFLADVGFLEMLNLDHGGAQRIVYAMGRAFLQKRKRKIRFSAFIPLRSPPLPNNGL